MIKILSWPLSCIAARVTDFMRYHSFVKSPRGVEGGSVAEILSNTDINQIFRRARIALVAAHITFDDQRHAVFARYHKRRRSGVIEQ